MCSEMRITSYILPDPDIFALDTVPRAELIDDHKFLTPVFEELESKDAERKIGQVKLDVQMQNNS